MRRRDYELLAAIIRDMRPPEPIIDTTNQDADDVIDCIAQRIATGLHRDNPRFDIHQFMENTKC